MFVFQLGTFMFACPCCGIENEMGRQGEFEICTICHWEDDPSQFSDPDYAGGANELSLNESRARWMRSSSNDKANSVNQNLDDSKALKTTFVNQNDSNDRDNGSVLW